MTSFNWTPEWTAAMLGSIKAWEKRAKSEHFIAPSCTNCPLCEESFNQPEASEEANCYCKACPVGQLGFEGCNGTPVDNYHSSSLSTTRQATAQKEVEFLKRVHEGTQEPYNEPEPSDSYYD